MGREMYRGRLHIRRLYHKSKRQVFVRKKRIFPLLFSSSLWRCLPLLHPDYPCSPKFQSASWPITEILSKISNFWEISKIINLSAFPPSENSSPFEFSRTTERIPGDGSVGIFREIYEGMSLGNVLREKQPFRIPTEIPREVLVEFSSENLFHQIWFVEVS